MSDHKSVVEALKTYAQRRVAIVLALGFSSGLPFLLVFQTLSAWLRQEGISRTEIGLLVYAGLAYTIKFLWAPIIDQIKVPILHRRFGRRRAWMLLSQSTVVVALVGLSFSDPAHALAPVAIFATMLAFASATQDICIDAWRIEAAPVAEQGTMAATSNLGYRLALLASGAGALYIAEFVSWHAAYLTMASLMAIGIVAALAADRTDEKEQPIESRRGGGAKNWLYHATLAPFLDFFARHGWTGIAILALIGTYRLPDFVMGVMAAPLYIDLGYSLATIASVVKIFGVWIMILGSLAGGVMVAKLGLKHTLLIGITGLILSNLVFSWLATQGGATTALIIAISSDNFSEGVAGTALIAYMSSLTSSNFTATQYALFSSFYALPGKLLGGMSGIMVDWFASHPAAYTGLFGGLAGVPSATLGYVPFFVFTAMMGFPAMLLILYVHRRETGEMAKQGHIPGTAH